jgi:hypothetical protein
MLSRYVVVSLLRLIVFSTHDANASVRHSRRWILGYPAKDALMVCDTTEMTDALNAASTTPPLVPQRRP